MLFNITNSTAASLPIKLAAARIFAKFKCSYSVAKKAYKVVVYPFLLPVCFFLGIITYFRFLLSYVMTYLMQNSSDRIWNGFMHFHGLVYCFGSVTWLMIGHCRICCRLHYGSLSNWKRHRILDFLGPSKRSARKVSFCSTIQH